MTKCSFTSKLGGVGGLLLTAVHMVSQPPSPPPPPPPPPPPQFMTMKGLELSCFDTPRIAEDGLEFFVCNGGGGLAGVRRKSDPAHTVFVRDPDIAQNLNMKSARLSCPRGRFAVHADSVGVFWFTCDDREISTDKFRAASKAEWGKYSAYLYR